VNINVKCRCFYAKLKKIFSVSVGVDVGEGMGIDDEKSWLILTHTLNLIVMVVQKTFWDEYL
jgi:hypothetical protein